MKKLLLLAGMLLYAGSAHATPSFEVGYSTGLPRGVFCTTGTAVQINATRPAGFFGKVAGYRVQNQDSADSVWIGGVSVSSTSTTSTDLAVLGERLVAGADGTYMLGVDYQGGGIEVPLYCRAADAAGTAAALLSIFWFGY